MNKFALLSVFLLSFLSVKAQDNTIIDKTDTISKENDSYELENSDGQVFNNSVPLSQEAKYPGSIHSEIDSNMSTQDTLNSGNTNEPPLCLSMNSGILIMPGFLDSFQFMTAIPDYYNKLKTGIYINPSAHYMVKDYLGLGVEYSFFKTSVSGSMPGEPYMWVSIVESEKYNLYIHYLGASVLFQQHLDTKQKFSISESLSSGALFFRLEYQNAYPGVTEDGYATIINKMLLTGKSFSWKMGVTADYRLFKAITVGFGSDYKWCSLKKANIVTKGSDNSRYSSRNQKLSKPMKLSQIDYSFVLRYYF